jgi:hypothetical protein
VVEDAIETISSDAADEIQVVFYPQKHAIYGAFSKRIDNSR